MIGRAPLRSAPLVERFCAGLVVLLAHGLLLIRLASTQMSEGVVDGHDRQGSMEVTFITLPDDASRGSSSRHKSSSHSPEDVKAPNYGLLPTQLSSAVENISMERDVHLATHPMRDQISQDAKSNNGLRAQYESAIRATVERKWQQLGQSSAYGKCTLQFTQLAGGVVTSATTEDCDLSAEDRLKLEAAVLMAQPLPYSGYESVFATEFELRF